MENTHLPVTAIGAGVVGAAALHLLVRGTTRKPEGWVASIEE